MRIDMNAVYVVLALGLSLGGCDDEVLVGEIDGTEARILGNASVGGAGVGDAGCEVSTELSALLQSGEFDIARGGEGNGDHCEEPYVMRLVVENPLDEVVLFDTAVVTIQTLSGSTILFDRVDPPLPNPFELTTAAAIDATSDGADAPARGIVQIDAIPTAYASQLDGFVGKSLHVEVTTLRGEGVSGQTVSTRAFRYPVEVCEGCLSLCVQQDILDRGFEQSDFSSEADCDDNAGADGRYCFDPDC